MVISVDDKLGVLYILNHDSFRSINYVYESLSDYATQRRQLQTNKKQVNIKLYTGSRPALVSKDNMLRKWMIKQSRKNIFIIYVSDLQALFEVTTWPASNYNEEHCGGHDPKSQELGKNSVLQLFKSMLLQITNKVKVFWQ